MERPDGCNIRAKIRATPWERDIAKSRIEFETLSAESLNPTQVYAVDERQVSASKAAERPTCVAPNLATFEERDIVGNSDQSEKTTEIIQHSLCTSESGVYRKQFHSASEKGVGGDKLDIYAFDNLDASDLCDSELAEHQSKCNILPEWPNCYGARGRETFIAPPTDSIINSTTRRVAHQIECEPVESDIEVTEAHRLFLADELLSAGQGVIEEFDYPPVPKQHSMCQSSSSRCAEKRGIDIDESEVISSQALRRKYLDREQTEEHSRVLYTSSPQNPDSGHIDINSSFRQGGLNEDELEQQQSLEQQSEGRLENDIRFVSHCKVMKDHENGSEVKFGTTAQNIEHQMNGKVERDPCVLVGNYNNLDVLEDEVLEKTMGWFPVEESCNEGNDPSLSVRWILDEPPTAADLPHLESLLEISPSKFWSPEPESGKRTSVHFGYLCRSESSQSPHSIQYFLNDSPTSSPEVTRTIFGGVPGSIISSKEPMHHCSQKRPDVHGAIQKIYSPCMDTAIPWTWRESLETSMKSPPLGSGRKYAQVQICVPQMSPAFSEDKRRKLTSREQNMVSTSNQDHAHEETGWVSDISSDGTVHRLMSQHGKNLVVDFLKVGSTTQEWIEAMRNDTELGDTFVPPSSKLWVQVENPTMLSDNMRVEFSAGLSDKKGMNALSALELQIPQGNRLTGTADALLKPFTSQEKPLDELQAHKPCKRRRDAESLPLSDISNHPNLAARLRGSLHEKLESQLEFPNTVLELVSKERPVSEQCPQNLAPGNIPWSTPGVPRVSRKRSSRVTTPKDTRPRVSNVLIDDNMLQAAADSPKKDYYTCKRGKKIPKSSIKELQTFPRNVKLRILMPDPASDRENDIMELTSREGRKVKSPILTKAVKPLRLIKTTPAKDYPWTRVRMTPKSNTVVKCEKNIEESGTGAERHEVKGNSLSKESPDIEANKMAVLRSSKYRGVTRHRHTGRFEAHLWDNSKVKLGLARRGRQVYLGAYTDEEQAARAHDLAALKYWGPGVHTNFPPSLYEEELTTMKNLTKEDYILLLRRKSPGFTRGISKYRGVTRHHQEGRWEARIGRHSGAKYHYLGTYDTEEEAAVAYDRAAVLHRGPNAVTNFDISNYIKRKPKNPKIEISLSPPQL